MQPFSLSPSEVRDLCKQYPKAEQIAELKAHHAAGSEVARMCEYMLDLTNDLKGQLPASSGASSSGAPDDASANQPSMTAPRKAK
jgi:hypothetical protein